jgi:hypothetical protein
MGAHMHIRITYMDIDIRGSQRHVHGSQKHMQATKHLLGWRRINSSERFGFRRTPGDIFVIYIHWKEPFSVSYYAM